MAKVAPIEVTARVSVLETGTLTAIASLARDTAVEERDKATWYDDYTRVTTHYAVADAFERFAEKLDRMAERDGVL